jgi:hypothetical protein
MRANTLHRRTAGLALLSPDQCEEIYLAALEVLDRVGVNVREVRRVSEGHDWSSSPIVGLDLLRHGLKSLVHHALGNQDPVVSIRSAACLFEQPQGLLLMDQNTVALQKSRARPVDLFFLFLFQ